MAHHRNASADDRARATGGSWTAALKLDSAATGLLDHAHGARDGLLVADLIRAERQIANHQGCVQPTLHCPREHQHVVEVNWRR